MTLLILLALLVAVPLLTIDLVFVAEVLCGLRATPAPAVPSTGATRIALLVPAHDEAAGLARSLAALRSAMPAGTRLLVVAHNCTDESAAIALAGGAQVQALDRPDERGKGYALAAGRDALAGDPPDVVICIDADCRAAPGAIERLATTALRTGGAVQAAYLFAPPPHQEAVVQVSNLAMLVKNLVRQRGARRLGGPALLTGSGMAFPWPLFARLDLATGNLVEDLALGLDLVARGLPPSFEEHAVIWSDPASVGAMRQQRSRWEGGFLATAARHGLPLLIDGIARARWHRLWLGLALLTPPLTLLLMLNGLAFAVAAMAWLLGAPSWWPAGAAIAGAGVVAAVIAAWAVAGRAMLPGRALVRLPRYLLWKLTLYARIAGGRDRPQWRRTARD